MSRTTFMVALLNNSREYKFDDGNTVTDIGIALIGDRPYEHGEHTRYPHSILATLRLKQNGAYEGNGKSLKELVEGADNNVLEVFGTLSKDLYWELRNAQGEVQTEERYNVPHNSSEHGKARSVNESELSPPEVGGANNWVIQDSEGEIYFWSLQERLVIEVFSPLQINYLPRRNGNSSRKTVETPVQNRNLKDTESQNRASQIQQFCEERGITTLCHFTRVENLQSILQEGLIGRSLLETHGQKFLFNDDDRIDGHKEAVCLSISFPNYKMFWNIRKEKEKTKGVKDSQWIVLLLDAKVLWELDCAFCQENAARTAVSATSLKNRKKPKALRGMFGDFYNIRHQDLPIPDPYLRHPRDAYPTHPQAEVLVLDPIPMRYIKAIYFWDAAAQKQWLPSSTGTTYETFCTNRQYFEPRRDYEVWKSENFKDGVPLSYIAKNNTDPSLSVSADDDDDIPF